MSAAIDEPRAWRLVRAITPGSVPEDGVIRVQDDDAFVEVDATGGWSTSAPVDEAARAILDLYLPIRTPRELVIGQLGQSLDGRIATESGASHFITGPEDIERLHRVRALMDAVVVGATTVVSDDPRLTVRLVDGDNPVRVVIDPSRRVGRELRVRADGIAPTILVRRATDEAPHADGDGDELYLPASGDGRLDLEALLAGLRSLGHRRVLIEGGGLTVSRFLEADLLDRLHVCVAPLLIGSGRPSISLASIESLEEAIRPPPRHFMLGQDVLFDLDLRSRS